MDVAGYFRGKKITVMGLGLLGRGIGDAQYLAECGAELIVTDLKPREELAESLRRLAPFPNIRFVLGEHRLEDFRGRDLILKAAGVPRDSLYIAEAKKQNIPVRMSADLFAELSGSMCVGVTGTRGKSTVTHLLHAILQEAGKKVVLGGNVRGVSTLALLREATPEHIAVLELDSWQLQGWGEARMSPHIAVFTTLYPDHMNYYRGDRDIYLADKANIFLYQTPNDTFILGSQCAELVKEKYGSCIRSKTIIPAELPDDCILCIPGLHNRYDAALALAAVRALGVEDAESRRALEAFKGVPGRLELVREVRGVRFYNDTTATTPEATLAALEALRNTSGQNQNLILILGGADKGLDMNALLARLPGVKKVILLAGTGTDRIKSKLPNATIHGSIAGALEDACASAQKGDAILFSPAFASFGMFKNEYDRGDQFAALAEALPR